jgi:serine phosphatase RsbU (regulator of sigma subunit)
LPPLGAGAAVGRHDDAEIPVEPGSTILLYTDGLVGRGSGIDEGFDRLREAMIAVPADLGELLSFVIAELVGKHPRLDDIAMIALKSSSVRRPGLKVRLAHARV